MKRATGRVQTAVFKWRVIKGIRLKLIEEETETETKKEKKNTFNRNKEFCLLCTTIYKKTGLNLHYRLFYKA